MSTEAIIAAVVVVLALAAQSVRSLVSLPKEERLGRVIVLVVAATLGALIVDQLVATDYWAFGIALGLGMVELGPVVSSVVKRFVRHKGERKREND